MKRIALTLLLICLAFVVPATLAEELKISCLNINFSNPHIEETLALIERFDPDLMLFQESTDKLAQGVKTFLPAAYKFTWFTEPGEHPAGGFAAVSKRPITDQHYIEKSAGLFGTQTFSITVGDQMIRVMNLHLNPAALPEKHNRGTALHAMIMNNKFQAREVKHILTHYQAQQPTIIAGDVNSFSNLAAYRMIVRTGFTDAHLSVDEDASEISTWKDGNPESPGEARFDYIFHNAPLIAHTFEVVEHPYSDHALLNCTLQMKKP